MNALLYVPKEVVDATMEAAAGKAASKFTRLLVLGMMAGAFIAMGAQASSLAVHGISDVGMARTLAGCIFPVGLMMIVFVGGELFTGDCMMSIAWMKREITSWQLLRTLVLVYLGNFIGAFLIGALVNASGQLDYSAGGLGAYTIKVAVGKTGLSFGRALASGVLCNILVCTAVLMAASAKDIGGKVLAIFFPIMAFVVSGFEHCVANMYYIPSGILALHNETYRVQAEQLYGLGAEALASLNWGNFVLHNLLPVTLGNIIGGSLVMGGVCYYLHGKYHVAVKKK